MNKFELATELIQEFYQINANNFEKEVFEILKKILTFKSGYITLGNPDKIEYSYNTLSKNFDEISSYHLKEDLIFKKTKIGQIIITCDKFSKEDTKIFKTCAVVIANIIKDLEVSKVIKIQLKALQDGYIDIKKDNKKIKEAEQVKTEFLSHVSHELRTPINSILGYSDLLGEECAGKLTVKQKEFVTDIKISSLHLLEMVNEILDMSKIEAGAMKLNLKEFQIQQCTQEVLNIIKPLILQKNQTLETEIDDFTFKADYQKIQQILFNLLSNAIKFTEENGKIKIICHKTSNFVEISIKDNGIGIAQQDIYKIFNKFEQLEASRQNSTGLGLAITKELINMHNGNIDVISEPKKGTLFIVRIPQ